MATANLQAISGLSPGAENEIMSVFPSIGSTAPGRALGRLFESIPLGKLPVKLSHLLFPLPLSPLAFLIYLYLKIRGTRYVLTNRAVVVKTALGRREITRVDLTDIAEATVRQFNGQYFYRCADLILLGTDDQPLLQLGGVPRADVFRQIILEARDAAVQVKASLSAIEARHTG